MPQASTPFKIVADNVVFIEPVRNAWRFHTEAGEEYSMPKSHVSDQTLFQRSDFDLIVLTDDCAMVMCYLRHGHQIPEGAKTRFNEFTGGPVMDRAWKTIFASARLCPTP